MLPWIGQEAVADLTPPQLLQVLRRIQSRGVVETAHRALQNCGQVVRYAAATGKHSTNPARNLGDAQAPRSAKLPGDRRSQAFWRVTARRPRRSGHAGNAGRIEAGAAAVVVTRRVALRRMGGNRAVRCAADGARRFIFRRERRHDRPMSENTINAALRAMGLPADELTGLGFRATARPMFHERPGYEPSVIEAQLAYAFRDSLGRACNRTEFVEQRRAMLQKWADYLDKLRPGAAVVKLQQPKA